MAETDLLQWNAETAIGIEKTDAATYPTQDATSDRFYVPFDDTDEEAIVLQGIMPQGYDSNQTLKLDIYYWMASAVADKVGFDVFVEAISPDDSFDMDGSSWDTVNQANEIVPGTGQYPSVLTVTLANKDSVAAGDGIRICVERNADGGAGVDDATGDCNAYRFRLHQES